MQESGRTNVYDMHLSALMAYTSHSASCALALHSAYLTVSQLVHCSVVESCCASVSYTAVGGSLSTRSSVEDEYYALRAAFKLYELGGASRAHYVCSR